MWATSAEVKLSRSSPGVEVSVVLEGLIEAESHWGNQAETNPSLIYTAFKQHACLFVCLFKIGVIYWGYIYIYIARH